MNSRFEEQPDEALALQTQAGDFAAYEALVSRYERRIFTFVNQICRDEQDALEITQDTFLKAFQAIHQFDPHRAFGAWLFTIARRKCIDHHRSAPPPAIEAMPDLADASNPAQQLAAREDHQRLWQRVRALLPDTQFQALWLRYAEEMRVEEIARVLGKTKTHVKVILFRARQTLERDLQIDAAEPHPMAPTPARQGSDLSPSTVLGEVL